MDDDETSVDPQAELDKETAEDVARRFKIDITPGAERTMQDMQATFDRIGATLGRVPAFERIAEQMGRVTKPVEPSELLRAAGTMSAAERLELPSMKAYEDVKRQAEKSGRERARREAEKIAREERALELSEAILAAQSTMVSIQETTLNDQRASSRTTNRQNIAILALTVAALVVAIIALFVH